MMKPRKNEDRISEIMNDPERVRLIIQSAIHDALLKHKQAGNPVCELRNGKIAWIKPQEEMVSSIPNQHSETCRKGILDTNHYKL